MGLINSKNESPKNESPTNEENIFISYYCDHLVNQKKVNLQASVRPLEKECLKDVYNYRKKSVKKQI
jgi:hypothetical protein